MSAPIVIHQLHVDRNPVVFGLGQFDVGFLPVINIFITPIEVIFRMVFKTPQVVEVLDQERVIFSARAIIENFILVPVSNKRIPFVVKSLSRIGYKACPQRIRILQY